MSTKLKLLRQFVDNIRYATYVFENEDAREGCAIACRSAAQLVKELTQNYRLTVPFMEVHEGFQDLIKKEIKPDIFEIKLKSRKRSRTSRREFTIMFAVALLDTLVELGDPLEQAARSVARGVSDWPEFRDAPITNTTLINWRKQRQFSESLSRHRAAIKEDLLSDRKTARIRIQAFLRDRPPVSPKLD